MRRDVCATGAHQKDGDITEDDLYTWRDKLQKVTDEYVGKVDDLGKQKEAEITEV